MSKYLVTNPYNDDQYYKQFDNESLLRKWIINYLPLSMDWIIQEIKEIKKYA